jgi:hypothetical protein
MSFKKGRAYEELIHKIYSELEPLADVTLNDKIKGFESGIDREIDVSVRSKIADHEILIIVQAKDHKYKADIKIIGEFESVIRDLRASKGILICSSGFTKTAKKYAQNQKIDICSAYDANSKDWKIELQVPVIRENINLEYEIKVEFKASEELFLATKGKLNINELL